MKHAFVYLIIVTLFSACTINRNSKSDIFKITVINKLKNLPVDSAKVELIAMIDYRDVYSYIKYTDKKGQCSFSFSHNPQASYQVRASKQELLGYYDSSYLELDRAFKFLNKETGNDVILYLTSDALQHKNFWASHEIRYEIDTLINILKSNKYPLRSEFPSLRWDDIPALLAIGNNRSLINKYPVSVISSFSPQDCYLGVIALWFIESIRITELKKAESPNEKFPSQIPSLGYSDIENPKFSSSTEAMEEAYQSYVIWWERIKDKNKHDASKINPLENSHVKWNY